MDGLIPIKKEISRMGQLALSMLENTFEGFMKHDLDILSGVLKEEQRLNEMETALTISLVELSKGKINPAEKKIIISLTNIVADLEQIGDYIKDIIERIEIKIEEKLLFSDEAVAEYGHLYKITKSRLADVVNSLETGDKNFAKGVLCVKIGVDGLIQKYRDAHTKRLINGICEPRACNMFLNLLDFTGQIFYHTNTIANNILKLK